VYDVNGLHRAEGRSTGSLAAFTARLPQGFQGRLAGLVAPIAGCSGTR
jgi:hypothetical protein